MVTYQEINQTPYYQQSSLYKGTVCHHRYFPKIHYFKYHLVYFYLNLDDLENWDFKCSHFLFSKFKWRPYRYRREDYHRPEISNLKKAVLKSIKEGSGVNYTDDVNIFILTQPRVLGFSFNPVSFYYLYEKKLLKCILAEINNTPWNERYHYIIHQETKPYNDKNNNNEIELEKSFSKNFHVSPFMSMKQIYSWCFKIKNNDLSIDMFNHENHQQIFRAGMKLKHRPLNSKEIFLSLLTLPFSSLKAFIAIYWHALLLKFKGVPYNEHPQYKSLNHAS